MSSSSEPGADTVNGTKNPLSESHAQSDANIRNFAPVARIMKSALPENAKIAKEAKECMQECVSEFISFITSEGRNLYPAVASHIVSGTDNFYFPQPRRNASKKNGRPSMERISFSP